MFNIIEMLFPVIFILIFIMIIFIFIKGIATWHKNNNSPRLTVSVKIVAKRQNTHITISRMQEICQEHMAIIQQSALLIMSLFK